MGQRALCRFSRACCCPPGMDFLAWLEVLIYASSPLSGRCATGVAPRCSILCALRRVVPRPLVGLLFCQGQVCSGCSQWSYCLWLHFVPSLFHAGWPHLRTGKGAALVHGSVSRALLSIISPHRRCFVYRFPS